MNVINPPVSNYYSAQPDGRDLMRVCGESQPWMLPWQHWHWGAVGVTLGWLHRLPERGWPEEAGSGIPSPCVVGLVALMYSNL